MTSGQLSHEKQQVPQVEDTRHALQCFLLQLLGLSVAQVNPQAGRYRDAQGRQVLLRIVAIGSLGSLTNQPPLSLWFLEVYNLQTVGDIPAL